MGHLNGLLDRTDLPAGCEKHHCLHFDVEASGGGSSAVAVVLLAYLYSLALSFPLICFQFLGPFDACEVLKLWFYVSKQTVTKGWALSDKFVYRISRGLLAGQSVTEPKHVQQAAVIRPTCWLLQYLEKDSPWIHFKSADWGLLLSTRNIPVLEARARSLLGKGKRERAVRGSSFKLKMVVILGRLIAVRRSNSCNSDPALILLASIDYVHEQKALSYML